MVDSRSYYYLRLEETRESNDEWSRGTNSLTSFLSASNLLQVPRHDSTQPETRRLINKIPKAGILRPRAGWRKVKRRFGGADIQHGLSGLEGTISLPPTFHWPEPHPMATSNYKLRNQVPKRRKEKIWWIAYPSLPHSQARWQLRIDHWIQQYGGNWWSW